MIKYLILPEFNLDTKTLFENLNGISYPSPNPGCTSYKLNDDCQFVKEFKEFLPEKFHRCINAISLQIIHPSWNDYIYQGPKQYNLNFIVRQGGDNVSTLFYDDNRNCIATESIPQYRWYYFDNRLARAVTNITEQQIEINISLKVPDDDFQSWLDFYTGTTATS